jgi:hypothetical protein
MIAIQFDLLIDWIVRTPVKRLLKFLHTIGAIGLMGATASLLVLMSFSPPSTSLAGYALMRGAMATIATWIFFPSFSLTLIAGLLAIAVNPAYHNAGWAWVKLAMGILVFSASLQASGSIHEEAERSASALAGQFDPDPIVGSLGAERSTLWVLLAVSGANVVLGIWRPRITPARGHQIKTQKQPDQLGEEKVETKFDT